MNAKDPLKNVPDAERELFQAFVKEANGFGLDQVGGAAGNMLVNCLRQSHATQKGALDGFDQLTTKLREVLASHYDGTGKRRNVFPFNQVIELPTFDFRRKQ